MPKTATIVTSFFSYKENEESSYHNILSLDAFITIYAEPELHDKIKNIRSLYDVSLSKTEIKNDRFCNMDSHILYANTVKSLTRDSQEVEKQLVDYNNLSYIKDAALNNKFKTSHFIWIPFSGLQGSLDKYQDKKIVANELLLSNKVVQFAKHEIVDTENLQQYYQNANPSCQYKIFIVPQDMAAHYYHIGKHEIGQAISMQVAPTISHIYDILAVHNPTKHEVILTDDVIKLCSREEKASVKQKIQSSKSMMVVVNHYQHDVSWVNRLQHPYRVYNKNPNEHHLFEYNLPNLGFDTIVYLRYIVDNYDNLPDYVAFVQDDPFYHCMNVLEILNEFKFDREFVPLSATYHMGDWDREKTENYARRINLTFNSPIKMIASAQVLVSKNLILKTSKQMYERIISTIDKTVKSEENYCIENLWPTILNFNEELVPHHWNCSGYGGNP